MSKQNKHNLKNRKILLGISEDTPVQQDPRQRSIPRAHFDAARPDQESPSLKKWLSLDQGNFLFGMILSSCIIKPLMSHAKVHKFAQRVIGKAHPLSDDWLEGIFTRH